MVGVRILFCFLFCCSLSAKSISIERIISSDELRRGASTKVTLQIEKKGVKGMAKLIEVIPEGFRVIVTNTGGGKMIPDQKGKIKIVWDTLPARDKIVVEYRLLHAGTACGKFSITGYFSYIDAELKQELYIKPSSVNVNYLTVNSNSEQKETSQFRRKDKFLSRKNDQLDQLPASSPRNLNPTFKEIM